MLKVRKASLRQILIISVVLQVFAAVGLTGYLSLRNSQKGVNQLAIRLHGEVTERIEKHLNTYMATPRELVQINWDGINLGLLNVQNQDELGQFFWRQVSQFDVGYILFGHDNGDYVAAGHFFEDGRITVDLQSNLDQNQDVHLFAWETDSQGKRTKIVWDHGPFDPHDEDWYSEAAQQGKSVWSPVYNWVVTPFPLSVAASRPVYDQNQKLLGVIAVEQRLSQISEFLRQLQVPIRQNIHSGTQWLFNCQFNGPTTVSNH